MTILALEFSSLRRSVAVLTRGPGGLVRRVGPASSESPQLKRPLPLIDSVLRQAQVGAEQIARLLVGLGPGSYTGIRSAIAVAQGWQLARGTPVLGVSSVDGLAARAQALGWFGLNSVVIDAQRQEFYLASFQVGPERIEVVEPLRLANLNEVQARVKALESTIIGPEVTRWFPGGRVLSPEAEFLAYAVAPGAAELPAEKLEPIYLREVTFVKAPAPTRGF